MSRSVTNSGAVGRKLCYGKGMDYSWCGGRPYKVVGREQALARTMRPGRTCSTLEAGLPGAIWWMNTRWAASIPCRFVYRHGQAYVWTCVERWITLCMDVCIDMCMDMHIDTRTGTHVST